MIVGPTVMGGNLSYPVFGLESMDKFGNIVIKMVELCTLRARARTLVLTDFALIRGGKPRL
jgi:hypothetical protein